MKLLFAALMLISTAAAGQSKIYFFRATGTDGWANGYGAFIDDTLVCKLNNNRYSIHDIKPGKHKITVQFSSKEAKDKAEPLVISVEAGRTYYIQLTQERKGLGNTVFPQEIMESSTKKLLEKCKLDSECKVE